MHQHKPIRRRYKSSLGGLLILLASAFSIQKPSIFLKVTFMTSREKNYVLIIDLGRVFEVP